MIPLTSIVALASYAVTGGFHPTDIKRAKWMDWTLAGYAFAYNETHRDIGVFDPKSGFMLVRGAECDGGDLTLLLTHDRKLVREMGYQIPTDKNSVDEEHRKMVIKVLPSLSTSKGFASATPLSKCAQN